ncbi:hypothetical protein CYMTET_46080 [Cymbomonas tetramitiformis]|uniref:Uncharacterized protein n=1 Tax=Cymbomonas tetramitiformis TaxID=36881 RepID=A0AAE0BY70_9CHLO|nr:hypothetical protein CYMTET_46080 [Cymbomonas tetramitiformis]|eukprot:gene847-1333_t
MCVPLWFIDETLDRKSFTSAQVATMCLLLSTRDVTVQARSNRLLKMYKGSITVHRDHTTGMRFRVLSVPPGLGKTAMVVGAAFAMMRNGTFQRILDTTDHWSKQVRCTSGVGAYFSDSGSASPTPCAAVIVVCPDNVWAYWHNTLAAHIAELRCASLYPRTAVDKFYIKKALELIRSVGVIGRALVMMTPTHYANFLKEGHNIAWPLTIFDEFSAHCSQFGNCATPLCREFWAMTATPTEICKSICGNLKTNPFRALLGDKFARCERRPYDLNRTEVTISQFNEMVCGNVQVLLLTTVPRSIIEWIIEDVSDLMYRGVSMLKRGAESRPIRNLNSMLHQPDHNPGHRRETDHYYVWNLLEDRTVSRQDKTDLLMTMTDQAAVRKLLRVSHFREVALHDLPKTFQNEDMSEVTFARSYELTVDNKRKRSRAANEQDPQPMVDHIHVWYWWNAESVCTLIDLPTVARMLRDAKQCVDHTSMSIADLSRDPREPHSDYHLFRFMRQVVYTDLHNKVQKLDLIEKTLLDSWTELDRTMNLVVDQRSQTFRKNFALRSEAFQTPFDLSKILMCMHCSCCFTMDDVLRSGWYMDNMSYTLNNDDIDVCSIEYLRCPECYQKLRIDEGVRPMIELDFGIRMLKRLEDNDIQADPTHADQLRRFDGFDFRRLLREEHLYQATDDFFFFGAAAMLHNVLMEAVLVRGMRRFIFFTDESHFRRLCVPMFESLRLWMFLDGAPTDIAYCGLKDGQRPGTSTCKVKSLNLDWYKSVDPANEVRALWMNGRGYDAEETHGMNLAGTNVIFFIGHCHNYVQAVSRGLRAGVGLTDRTKYLTVYKV